MDTMKKLGLPLLAGALFAAQVLWMIFFRFSIFEILVYIVFAVVLLLRSRRALPIAAVLLVLDRLWIVNVYADILDFQSSWRMMAAAFLAGGLLLLLFVLVNSVPALKKFRPWVNPLWFLPGGIMLLTDLLGCIFVLASDISPLLAVQTLDILGCSPLEALAVLLVPLWLALTAGDDLRPYEEMAGGMITPEQLEEKRRELGLAGRRANRKDT